MSGIAWIILAAGDGKRLMSAFPEQAQAGIRKPFLRIAGKPMVDHLLDKIGTTDPVILVVAPSFNSSPANYPDNVIIVHQACPMGTGHAFQTALVALPEKIETVIVLNGDGPAVPVHYIRQLSEKVNKSSSSVILVRRAHLPFAQAMGRYNTAARTIEENPEIRHPDDLINTGVYIFRNDESLDLLAAVTRLPLHEPSRLGGQPEYYLTDILDLVHVQPQIINDKNIAVLFQGVNTLEEYEFVESLF